MSNQIYVNYKLIILLFCALLVFNISILSEQVYSDSDDSFTIVTTFTVLEDFARKVAGDDADVRVITSIGAEIHEWELKPDNFVDLEQADIVFYNGYNVEQWINQVRAAVNPEVPVIPIGEKCNYPTLPIVTGDYEGVPDPISGWMSREPNHM